MTIIIRKKRLVSSGPVAQGEQVHRASAAYIDHCASQSHGPLISHLCKKDGLHHRQCSGMACDCICHTLHPRGGRA